MYPKYKCLGCGNVWRSGEIMIICPVCRGKGIKIKNGIDIKEVVKKLKDVDPMPKIKRKTEENIEDAQRIADILNRKAKKGKDRNLFLDSNGGLNLVEEFPGIDYIPYESKK